MKFCGLDKVAQNRIRRKSSLKNKVIPIPIIQLNEKMNCVESLYRNSDRLSI